MSIVILKIIALLLMIATAGQIRPELVRDHKWAQLFANLVAVIAAIYLAKDIWNDLRPVLKAPVEQAQPVEEKPRSEPPAPKPAAPPREERPLAQPRRTETVERPVARVPAPPPILVVSGEWSLAGAALLLGVALISGMFAMYRGASLEIIALMPWICTAMVVYLMAKGSLLPWLVGLTGSTVGKILTIAAGGLVTLIVAHLAATRVADQVLDSRIGVVDRMLGLVFGAARGLVLVVILAEVAAAVLPADTYARSMADVPLNYVAFFGKHLSAAIIDVVR